MPLSLVSLGLALLSTTGTPGLDGSPARSARTTSYTITARLDPAAHTVTGEVKIDWLNPSRLPAKELELHAYLNAFKNDTTRFAVEGRHSEGFGLPDKPRWGGLDVTDVQVMGAPVTALTWKDDGTVLSITPARPVSGRGQVSITARFVARLPEVIARSGYAGDFYLVGQWFPKLGVRAEDGTWSCPAYHHLSEYHSEFGVYRVTLEVPRRFGVVATGKRVTEEAAPGGYQRHAFLAEDVIDFAWAAAPGLQRATRRLGDVELAVAHLGEPAAVVASHLAAARATLDRLQRWYGPYPYPVLTVVLVPPGASRASGMEYPTLVTSSRETIPLLNPVIGVSTTIHEVVHQVFFGLLSSNEHAEPWLDEGFTTYVTGLVMDELAGDRPSVDRFGLLRLDYFGYTRLAHRTLGGWDAAARAAPEFASPSSYFGSVYARPALALRTVERHVGADRMRALLHGYVARHRFGHPTARDFLAMLDHHVPEPALRRFFRQAIQTDGVLDYAVTELWSRPIAAPRGRFTTDLDRARRATAALRAGEGHESEVLLRRRGELVIPVDVELRFQGGGRRVVPWDGAARWHRIQVTNPRPLEAAVIDPEGKLALERTRLDNGLRVKADARPARRVGGRLLAGLQLVLGLVGF